MNAVTDKPGLAEQYGVAINASSLTVDEGRHAIDLVAAMGYAQIALDRLPDHGGSLAVHLWRAKLGRDEAALRRACDLFAQLLCALYPYMAEIERADPGIVRRFAARSIDEAIVLVCGRCGGGGRLLALKGGARVRPVGVQLRAARLAPCELCRGRGRRIVSAIERRRVLGDSRHRVDDIEYGLFWKRRFAISLSILRELMGEPREPLANAR